MALQLTKKKTRVFKGSTGSEVILDISVVKKGSTALATILSVTYGGTTVNEPPVRVTVVEGTDQVVVVFVSTPGTLMNVEEVDGADPTDRQTLAQTTFEASEPNVVFVIQGS